MYYTIFRTIGGDLDEFRNIIHSTNHELCNEYLRAIKLKDLVVPKFFTEPSYVK